LTFHQFDQGSIPVSIITNAITSTVLSLISLAGAFALFSWLGPGWPFFSLVGFGIFLIGLLWWFSIFWPAIEYRYRSWRLSNVGLEIRAGVWFKEDSAVPWARVQHADVSQGPIQRMYGIGTLTVHTAGTSNSAISLEGMNYEKAIELRDEIIRQRKTGDVV